MEKNIARYGRHFVYIAQCCDGTYYTGYTNDLEKRLREHNNSCSRGAKYLRGKLPVKLVYAKEYAYYKRVLQTERRLKKLSHRQKQELVRTYERNQ